MVRTDRGADAPGPELGSGPGPEPQSSGALDPRFPLPEGPACGAASITAIVIARNEERNLGPCLSRLAWVDRILVIDDGSTDATVAEARRFTRWVMPGAPHEGTDPVHAHLNDAFRRVPEGWILQVDADERVSDGLAAEIRQVVSGQPDATRPDASRLDAAFRVPFRTAVLGRWVQHGYWGGETRLIRLWRAGSAHYPLQAVHESVVVDGLIGTLRHPIYHLPYPTVSEFVHKTNLYTSREVAAMLAGRSRGVSGAGAKAGHPSAWRLLAGTARIFFWSFLRRGGFRAGRWGMATSLMITGYAFLEMLKVWERAEDLDRPPSLPGEPVA